ncbi:hypothetical protein ACFX2J_047116 [Malus domestica]
MEDEVDRREMRKWNCTCDSCPTSTTANTTSADSTTTDSDTTTSTTSSFLEYPLRTGKFLSSEELEQLKLLEDYKYYQELESGSMWVRVMRPEESPSVCSPSSSWSRCFCLMGMCLCWATWSNSTCLKELSFIPTPPHSSCFTEEEKKRTRLFFNIRISAC